MNNNEYSTKDLYLAAFLKTKGMSIIRVEKRNLEKDPKRDPAFFVFDNPTRCLELTSCFFDGTGTDVLVNVYDFWTTLKSLRSRVYSIVYPKSTGRNEDD